MKSKKYSSISILLLLIILGLTILDAYLYFALDKSMSTGYQAISPWQGDAEELISKYMDNQRRLDSVLDNWCISADLADESKELGCAVRGVDARYFSCYPARILSGRLFFQEDCDYKRKVAIINESFCFELFRTAEAIGNEIKIDGFSYTIIGIIEDPPPIGVMKYQAYVPITAISVCESVTISGISNIGGKNLTGDFSNIVSAMLPDAAYYNLQRECEMASFHIRCLILFFSLFIFVLILKKLTLKFKQIWNVYITGIKDTYWYERFLPFILNIFLYLVIINLHFIILYRLLTWFTGPLNNYSEWIPNFTDIDFSFFDMLIKNQEDSWMPLISLSREMHRIRWFSNAIMFVSFLLSSVIALFCQTSTSRGRRG